MATLQANYTDGVLIVNVGHVPGSDALEKVVSATIHAAFPVVMRDRVNGTNTLVVGSTKPLSGAQIVSTPAASPAGLRRLATTVGGRLTPTSPGGAVYTDDRAPVEWLTDFSILRYATGQR